MDKKIIGVYDESCMYPLLGGTNRTSKRLAILCKKYEETLTPEEKRISDLLATGEMTPEIMKTLIIEEG